MTERTYKERLRLDLIENDVEEKYFYPAEFSVLVAEQQEGKITVPILTPAWMGGKLVNMTETMAKQIWEERHPTPPMPAFTDYFMSAGKNVNFSKSTYKMFFTGQYGMNNVKWTPSMLQPVVSP